MKILSSPYRLRAGVGLANILLLFSLILPAKAALPLKIIINEIAWMGTEVSFNDEWIELYNNTSSPIDLSGWKLVAEDGTPKIILSGIISSHDFYLLERTDDTTISSIAAHQIYTGALGNQGENLKLFDDQNNLIDEVNCSSGWFEGDNSTKQTMERKNPSLVASADNWQISQNPGGTPKAKNQSPSLKTESLPISNEIIKETIKSPEDKVTEEIKKELAVTGFQTLEKNSTFLKIFSIALLFAFFSGIVVLMVKKLIFCKKSDKL